MMKCDGCGTTIGNTLYEVGDKKLCPVCWLGEKEGSKPKYQQFDAPWTVESLAASKRARLKGVAPDVKEREVPRGTVERIKEWFKAHGVPLRRR